MMLITPAIPARAMTPLKALPKTSMERPGILAVDPGDAPLAEVADWRAAIAVVPETDGYRLVEEMMTGPVIDVAELLTRHAGQGLPPGWQALVKGAWWVVRASLLTREVLRETQKPVHQRKMVPLALRAAGQAVSGLALAQSGLTGTAPPPVYGQVGILLRYARHAHAGEALGYVALEDELKRSQPGYELVAAALKACDIALSADPAFKEVTVNPLRAAGKATVGQPFTPLPKLAERTRGKEGP
jgi:hypothetical protein